MGAAFRSPLHQMLVPWIVWLLRLAIGITFIVSGLAKSIDPWGFIYKVEEYLHLWNMMQPRSLVLAGAIALSGAEFVLGVLLATGCYKRVAVWLMLAMMAGMLPLTAYIYIADPVADCGCFGDFMIISNGATLLKNIAITAALLYLCVYNRRVAGVYSHYSQWIVGGLCSAYIIFVAFVGYNIQPLADFRSFPVGRNLAVTDDAEGYVAPVMEFVYEKGGETKVFYADALPDSTWIFVDRREKFLEGERKKEVTDLVVTDEGEDVSAEVISPEGYQLLVLIPEYDRADVAYTYLVNELNSCVETLGGSTVAIIAGDRDDIEEWADLSMADYPIYSGEPTMIKEMARGNLALVGLKDGTIMWKRTAGSVDTDLVEKTVALDSREADEALFESLGIAGGDILRNLSLALIAALAVLFMLDRSGRLLKWQTRINHLKTEIIKK